MTLDRSELVAIRDYTPADRNFVFSTLLRGIYYGGFFYGEMNKATFMEHYHNILEQLIPNTKITVACDKSDPDVIYSYCVTNPSGTVVHWVFTKAAWRGIGLAKSLVPLTVESVSHLSKQGLSILRKFPNIEFNPFNVT